MSANIISLLIIEKVLYKENDVVPVGIVIAVINMGGDSSSVHTEEEKTSQEDVGKTIPEKEKEENKAKKEDAISSARF